MIVLITNGKHVVRTSYAALADCHGLPMHGDRAGSSRARIWFHREGDSAPVPVALPVILIHGTSDAAVQPQTEPLVVTLNAPGPSAAGIDVLVGAIENVLPDS